MLSLAKYSQSLLVMGSGKVPPTSTPTTLRTGPIALPGWPQSTPHSSGNPISPTVTTHTHGGTAVGNAIIIGKGANEKPIHYEGPDDLYLKWAGLQPERMPKHVMVMLDGNRRWCEKNGTELTYEPFYRRYITLADLCIKLGIPTATWSVFSTCTWKRSDVRFSFYVLLSKYKCRRTMHYLSILLNNRYHLIMRCPHMPVFRSPGGHGFYFQAVPNKLGGQLREIYEVSTASFPLLLI